MKTTIRRMGNSQGVLIPKPVLVQLGFEKEVEMQVEEGALVLRPVRSVRAGWAQASQQAALAGDDALVMGEFANVDDAALEW
ncbi:MAG: AbrB/MazE/SpoVT family DNA-binding domain-containing protein [Janthinobacterium lividum]